MILPQKYLAAIPKIFHKINNLDQKAMESLHTSSIGMKNIIFFTCPRKPSAISKYAVSCLQLSAYNVCLNIIV